ncbi:Nitrogen permease regulator 3 [Orbilia oligospora]|uniref:Nitrogen permease regulator 3 n=1 Tax=Orbilia oligospora TaxID=2813651 RepID=A0A8H2HTL3_ORBOL|nr:Nitrogen permease regulator 3 [Orbilia oligospora]
MATERSLIPNPSLVAILLVIRDPAGGNLVFHYPPQPRSEAAHNTSSWRIGETNTDYTSSNSSFSSSSSDDDDGDDRKSRSTVRLYGGGIATERSVVTSQRSRSYDQRSSRRRRGSDHEYDDEEEDDDEAGEAVGAEWEHVLGFRHDVLAGLLSVPRALAKSRFELSVDHSVFLGYPCYSRIDGTWQRKKKERKVKSEGPKGEEEKEAHTSDVDNDDEDAKGNDADDEDPDVVALSRSKSPNPPPSERKKIKREPRKVEATPSKLAMFHIVFVMNPPQLEYHSRMHDMYDVAKQFTMALKTQQSEDDYVAREAERILEIRERGEKRGDSMHELWLRIIRESTLAAAIATLYQSISASKIAHLKVNDFDFALQIPIMMETAALPSISEPQLPGMHLTTLRTIGATPSEGEDALMTPHFTLLFLEDVDDIIKEIILDQDQSSLSASFVQFIQNCRPTVSFAQMLSPTSDSSAPHPENPEYQYIEYFARHLIYWRKARAIMPLHYRRYYIVSPNADMKRLVSQSIVFARLFPALPPLPKMLSLLSGKPRPYSAYIPSKDHRQAYMDMLAWLMRYGWVTNLLTFAYLKIPKDIKVAVRERQKREQAEAAVEMIQAATVSATTAVSAVNNNGNSPRMMSTSIEKYIANGTAIPNTSLRDIEEEPKISLSVGGDSSISNSRPRTGWSDVTDSSTTAPSRSTNPTTNTPGTPFEKMESSSGQLEDSIVYDPSRATPLESTWIERLTEGQPPDIVALFDRLVKYLDGQHAIEGIALREAISKKELKRVLNAMDRYIVYARHW